jgi:hypothetical protein
MPRMTALLSVGLIAVSIAAPSLAAGGREATKEYTITRGFIHIYETDSFIGTQPEFFRARPGERWLELSLTDNTGQPVLAHVEINGRSVEFCSDTQKPIRVTPAQKIAVSAVFGPCDGAFSTVTQGTITATFSN